MLLIADSGSTKTDWRLLAADGTQLAIQTDGFNPYYQSAEQISTNLREQLLPNVQGLSISQLFFYGAGCAGPAVRVMTDALHSSLPDVQQVDVQSDMLGAARAVCGRTAGIVSILGTGSNACCYDGKQLVRGIQSLGFWLGDEGSGGYLGKTLVQTFFQNNLPPELHDAFAARYFLNRATLLDNAYQKPFPNRYFASFTPFLADHLAHSFVANLVTNAFVLFLQTYVVRFPEAARWPVHAVGSIGYYFPEQWKSAIQQTNLLPGQLIKAPIEQLVEFHKQAG